MGGLAVKREDIPQKLQLYLFCCPLLDLNLRCLPREGGFYEQYLEDLIWFEMIETRLKETMVRQASQAHAKAKGRF